MEAPVPKQPYYPVTYPAMREEPDEPAYDIRRVIAAFRRRFRAFTLVGAGILALTVAIILIHPVEYTADTAVVVDQRKQEIVKDQDVVSVSDMPDQSAAVDTEVEVIQSRAIAEKVAAAEGLFSSNQTKDKGLFQDVRHFAHRLLHGAAVSETQAEHEAIIDDLQSALDVSRNGESYLIDISFTSDDPQEAAQFANAFAQKYMEAQTAAKFGTTQKNSGWMSQRLAKLRQQVHDADAAVQAYKIAHNLLSTQGQTLAEQEVSGLDQQLALARADQAEKEANLSTAKRQLENGSTGDDVGAALSSPVIQQLRQQRAQMSAKIADMASDYGPKNPDMIAAQEELADIDRQIQTEIKRVISNLEAQAQVARGHTASVQASINQVRSTLSSNNQASVTLNELQRNSDSANALYQSFLDRYKRTSAEQGMESPDARIVSAATIPGAPSGPKMLLDLALGTVVALILATGTVILLEMLDSGLTTATDIERHLPLRALGSIPMLASVSRNGQLKRVSRRRRRPLSREEKKRIVPPDFVAEHPLSAFTESFRNLRSSLRFARSDLPARVVAITSSLPDEGKTTTALCLARVAAIGGDRVIIVDCDLRRRNVDVIFPEKPAHGLIDVLMGDVPAAQVIRRDETSGADVLPLGHSPYTPRDIFNSAAMKTLLSGLAQYYDLVILDTPPLLAISDARAIAHAADATVLLARWRSTPRKAIESAIKMLSGTDAFLAGIVLTLVDQREQSRFGYGDPGYYFEAVQKYYAS